MTGHCENQTHCNGACSCAGADGKEVGEGHVHSLLEFAAGKYGIVLGERVGTTDAIHAGDEQGGTVRVEQRLILRDLDGPCLRLENVPLWSENAGWRQASRYHLLTAVADIDRLVDAGRDMAKVASIVKKHG